MKIEIWLPLRQNKFSQVGLCSYSSLTPVTFHCVDLLKRDCILLQLIVLLKGRNTWGDRIQCRSQWLITCIQQSLIDICIRANSLTVTPEFIRDKEKHWQSHPCEVVCCATPVSGNIQNIQFSIYLFERQYAKAEIQEFIQISTGSKIMQLVVFIALFWHFHNSLKSLFQQKKQASCRILQIPLLIHQHIEKLCEDKQLGKQNIDNSVDTEKISMMFLSKIMKMVPKYTIWK